MGDNRELICVNGHDRCYLGPDPDCPYCELRAPRRRMTNQQTEASENGEVGSNPGQSGPGMHPTPTIKVMR